MKLEEFKTEFPDVYYFITSFCSSIANEIDYDIMKECYDENNEENDLDKLVQVFLAYFSRNEILALKHAEQVEWWVKQ